MKPKVQVLKPFLFPLFLMLALHLNATTITWLGGTGSWNNPLLWDSGTIPSYGDQVIIPFGKVKITSGSFCNATTVDVSSGANLNVLAGGTLTISGAVDQIGLTNSGTVKIWGNLVVENILSPAVNHDGKAILNNNFIKVLSTGRLDIITADDTGLENASNGTFRNLGTLHIENIDGYSIKNDNLFANSGTLDIDAIIGAGQYAIFNLSQFNNLVDGEVLVNGGYTAYGNYTNGALDNYGTMTVENSSAVGFYTSGTIINHDTGTMTAESIGRDGVFVATGGTFINNGYLTCRHSEQANLFNAETFINYGSVTLFHAILFNLELDGWAVFNNYGFVNTSDGAGDTDFNIINGYYTNYNTGVTIVQAKIDLKNNSAISNSGFFISYYDLGQHFIDINATVSNYGVIEDLGDAFPTTINNQQLIIKPITAPMQVGVPFANVMEVSSLSNLTINDWYTDQNSGIIAGTYNEGTNEFTPNINSVGLDLLYISIEINSSNAGRNCNLIIEGGILPLVEDDPSQFFMNQDQPWTEHLSHTISNEEFGVYPNPTTGFVQIESNLLQQADGLRIYNALGQLVWAKTLQEDINIISLDFPNELSNGIYTLQMIRKDKPAISKRIQLQR